MLLQMAFVRLVGADGSAVGSWAEVELLTGDTVARLADRACTKFPFWRVTAAEVSLFLVAAADADEPSAGTIAEIIADDDKRLRVNKSLSVANIHTGAWLVARVSAGAAAAGGA